MAEPSIETQTALTKLARALEIPVADVVFLDHLAVEDLRTLQWNISDVLGAANRRRLQGVANASKLIPVGLAATIGEKWFGPVLCAQLVGLIEPARGGQFAKQLSVPFMADITRRTDPRVVSELVNHLSVRTMQKIAIALLDDGDYLTLSHFVGHLPPETIGSILDAIDDNAAVVRIARFVDDVSNLNPVVALLPDSRIVALVEAVDEADLWVDGLHLFSQLEETQITRIATTIVDTNDGMIASALQAFDRHDLWQQGFALVDHLDAAHLATFADVLLVVNDDLIAAAVDAIDTHNAWPTLVRIARSVEHLAPNVQARLRSLVESLPAARVDGFRAASTQLGYPDLLSRVLGT